MATANVKRMSENEKYAMGNKAENVSQWREDMDALYTALTTIHAGETPATPLPRFARSVRTQFQTFCAYQQYLTLDALDKQDYPNGIDLNSIYLTVVVDLVDKTFQINSSGHVYLTREEMKATNYAMTSIKNIVLVNGGKWGRKTKYKDAQDFAKKLTSLWESAMAIVSEQTDGYPYKQLREGSTPIRQYKTA